MVVCDDDGVSSANSLHPPMGLLSRERFDPRTQLIEWTSSCYVLLCSDGVVEAASNAGELFGVRRLRELVQAHTTGSHDRLPAALSEHLKGQKPADDLSILGVKVHRQCVAAIPPQEASAGQDVALLDIETHITLGPARLRYLDVSRLIDELDGVMKWPPMLRSRLAVVLTELIVNAIDYGLLCLDPRLKRTADGFEHYLELRRLKQSELQQGAIDITARSFATLQGHKHELTVEHAGNGRSTAANDALDQSYSGRGLKLVQSLVDGFTFGHDGRRVEVILYLTQQDASPGE